MPSVPFNPNPRANPFAQALGTLEMPASVAAPTSAPPGWDQPPTGQQLDWMVGWCVENIPGFVPPDTDN